MSSFFDNLEAQLRSAARARTVSADSGDVPARGARQRGLGWLRAGVSAVPIVAAVLVTLVVVGAALVLAGHGGHGSTPPQGSPPPGGQSIAAILNHTPKRQLHRELAYIATATAGVHRSKTCHLQQLPRVSYIHGSPGQDLLSILGVLRRPASPADRPNPDAVAGTPDIYRSYVRRAASAEGFSYYIVPARYDRVASMPSDRCFELQAAALKRELPKLPASLRQPTRELQAAFIAYARAIVAHAPRDTVCFASIGHNGAATQCGIGPEAIKAGRAVQQNQGVYSGLVPDGVATVTLAFPATSRRPAHAVTASVNSNVYAAQVSSPSVSLPPPTVTWRSSDGHVIQRISVPSTAAQLAACRRNPVACLAVQGATTETGSVSSSASPRKR